MMGKVVKKMSYWSKAQLLSFIKNFYTEILDQNLQKSVLRK